MGSTEISESESIDGIIQEGNTVYIVSQSRGVGGPGYAISKYHLRTVTDAYKSTSIEPVKLISFSYCTNQEKTFIDTFFNGEENIPAAIFHTPKSTTGYNGNMVLEYSPIEAVKLKDTTHKVLTRTGYDVSRVMIGEKGLVSILIPASKVPELMKESEVLRSVYDQDDQQRVVELNKANELEHRQYCWGTSSCIDTETFEETAPSYYPRYRVIMDLTGKIHQAERVTKK